MRRTLGALPAEENPAEENTAEDGNTVDFLRPTDKPDHIGCFGPYDVIEVVGRGGMGIVLKAHDPSLRRIVAIKVLLPTLATGAVARKRFIREARAVSAVSHENVVTIHAVDEADGLPYLVMQFVPGRSLEQRIWGAGPLELKEVLRVGMQMASGLAAAHAQGIVHRDITPANILLENDVERVKTTDFGLARAMDDVTLTRTGLISGTPQYMAPEQTRDELVDHRADLFSLGAVLYTMCTGTPPFIGSSLMSILRKVCEENPRPIQEVNEDIPRWLVVALVIAVVGQRLLDRDQPSPIPPPVSQPAPPSLSQTFMILAEQGATGRTFDTLAEAVHVAQPGDTIEVRFNGTFQTESIQIRRKPLVIRAAVGFRPTIEVQSDRLPLFSTNAFLALEGLSLQREETGSPIPGNPPRGRPLIDPRMKPLVASREAELFAAHTRFSLGSVPPPVRPNQAVIDLDQARSCELRSCEFHTGRAMAVHWAQRDGETNSQAPTSTLIVHNCVHGGFEFLVADFSGPDLATARLSRNTFLGARLMRLMHHASPQASQPPLSVEASENIFDVAELLATLEVESPRKCITWQGRRNVFAVEWSFLGEYLPPRGLGQAGRGPAVIGPSLEEWSAFWDDTDCDSDFGTVHYPGVRGLSTMTTPSSGCSTDHDHTRCPVRCDR